jgi:hypothetical protein
VPAEIQKEVLSDTGSLSRLEMKRSGKKPPQLFRSAIFRLKAGQGMFFSPDSIARTALGRVVWRVVMLLSAL